MKQEISRLYSKFKLEAENEWFKITTELLFWEWDLEKWKTDFKKNWSIDLTTSCQNTVDNIITSCLNIWKSNIFFYLEKDSVKTPFVFWNIQWWSIKLSTISRYYIDWVKFNMSLDNTNIIIDIIKDLWLDIEFVLNIFDEETLKSLKSREIKESYESASNIINLSWFKDLDDYLATLDQKTRTNYRRARKELRKFNVRTVAWKTSNSDFKKLLEKSMLLNREESTYTNEEWEEIIWSVFKEINWEYNHFMNLILSLEQDDMHYLEIFDNSWNTISTYFYQIVNNKCWLINWSFWFKKNRFSFKMLLMAFFEEVIDQWVTEVDMMSYDSNWFKKKLNPNWNFKTINYIKI